MRLPLLAGSRFQVVQVGDDAVLLPPPPPLAALVDTAAAVAEALRYPLSGPPLEELVTVGGRATIVVEPPTLPLPGAPADPRQEALAAVIEELDRLGMPRDRHTVLVAGGLERRSGRRELEALLRPARARAFRGDVVVHDCEDEGLRPLAGGERSVSVNRQLLAADLVVTVTAAETVDRGGPATLLAACETAATARAAPASSLLEPTLSSGWRSALAVETALAARVPVLGVSLTLDHPRLTGPYRGYPWAPETLHAATRSPFRRLLGIAPSSLRRAFLQRLARDLKATAAFAGPPSVAHAEALLRGIALRGAALAAPLDTIVVPLPWKAPHQPRLPLNPITAAAVGLGLALRLWRHTSPLAEGGTVVLLHDFHRAFSHGAQAPFRELFQTLRESREPGLLREAEAAARVDGHALADYRAGQAPHPLLPFADWASCGPVLERAGRVIVAGCRDAAAARALGFVPSHNATTALEMARGVAGGTHRLGVLLAPPYAPLVVGT